MIAPLSDLAAKFKRIAGWKGSELEEFQNHLLELNLLGRQFELDDYIAALMELWGTDIWIRGLDDADPLLHSQVLKEGSFGEVSVSSSDDSLLIKVRESYKYRTWPTYERVVYHELAHPARRHWGEQAIRAEAQDQREQHATEALQEQQAEQWAKWLLLASREPTLFSREATQTLT